MPYFTCPSVVIFVTPISLRNIATELLSEFSRVGLRELDQKQPEAWAKDSYEIAVKIAYEMEIFVGLQRDGS